MTEAAQTPEPTDARFSLRSLLIAMAIVAVIAMLLGPIVRLLSPDKQMQLLLVLAAYAVALALVLAYQARRRLEAERLVGRTLVRLPLFDERVPTVTPTRYWLNVVLAFILILFSLGSLALSLLSTSAGRPDFSFLLGASLGAACIFWSSRIVTSFWWRNHVRFCERGVLWDRRALLWDHFVDHTWSGDSVPLLTIKGVDQFNFDMHLRIEIPVDHVAEVRQIVDVQAHVNPHVALSPRLDLTGLSLSKAVKDPQFRAAASKFALLFVLVEAWVWVSAGGLTGVREFDRTVIWGIVLGGFVPALFNRGSGLKGGLPLVRLSCRAQWGKLLCFSAVAYGSYYAGRKFGIASEWIGYSSGLALGAAAIAAVGAFAGQRIDLCENGLLVSGRFVPWSKVQVKRWDPMHSGELKLGYGWSSVTMRVPTRQREVVDGLLAEKLAYTGAQRELKIWWEGN